jgi:uncharacterized membrane protein HdeD (DUF308 family)
MRRRFWGNFGAGVDNPHAAGDERAPDGEEEPLSAIGEPHSLGQAIHRLRAKWGAIVAFGLLLMLLGAASLAFVVFSTLAMVTLNGVLLVVAGAAEIGVGMHARSWGRFFLWVAGGGLYVLAGVFCIFDPRAASAILTLMIGAGLIAAAIVRAYLAFELPASPRRSLVGFGCAVTFLLGLIIVIHWPMSSAYVLGTLLGVDLLFHGAGWVSFALGLRAHR